MKGNPKGERGNQRKIDKDDQEGKTNKTNEERHQGGRKRKAK